MGGKPRLLFVDNLRLAVIALVVCLHAAVTYSGLGSWYYKETLPQGPATHLFFAVFQSFSQAFFMGVLFLLAGYYAAASLRSRGTAGFVTGRLVRLGLPALFYMAVMQPLMIYYLLNGLRVRIEVPFSVYYRGYLTSAEFPSGSGPMWFAVALLVFCLVYALASLGARPGKPAAQPSRPPSAVVALLAVVISLGAFLLRLRWPIGTNVYNMQLGYFSQYMLLFCFGTVAYGRNWLAGMDAARGGRLVLAAVSGIPVLIALIVCSGAFDGNPALRGGWNWASAAFAVWESVTGVCMSVGLLGVLRARWNTQAPLVASLSACAFAVYLFHPPVLIGISLGLRHLPLGAFAKFLLASALALPASFAVAWLARRTPLVRDMVRS